MARLRKCADNNRQSLAKFPPLAALFGKAGEEKLRMKPAWVLVRRKEITNGELNKNDFIQCTSWESEAFRGVHWPAGSLDVAFFRLFDAFFLEDKRALVTDNERVFRFCYQKNETRKKPHEGLATWNCVWGRSASLSFRLHPQPHLLHFAFNVRLIRLFRVFQPRCSFFPSRERGRAKEAKSPPFSRAIDDDHVLKSTRKSHSRRPRKFGENLAKRVPKSISLTDFAQTSRFAPHPHKRCFSYCRNGNAAALSRESHESCFVYKRSETYKYFSIKKWFFRSCCWTKTLRTLPKCSVSVILDRRVPLNVSL